MTSRWKPHVTVAAIIERDGRFLFVEEHTPEGLRLNNPAGHLDPGESPVEACVRETMEETAFEFTPNFLVGVYLSRSIQDVTYLRFAFCGDLGTFNPTRNLDTGITRTLWLTANEVRQSCNLLRSPLVLRCMEDYLKGQRYSIDLIYTDPSVTALT